MFRRAELRSRSLGRDLVLYQINGGLTHLADRQARVLYSVYVLSRIPCCL
jgi:hypothetical protein